MQITPTLPKREDLTGEQDLVLSTVGYYEDQDAIIIGGPGTGKSILAGHRAIDVSKKRAVRIRAIRYCCFIMCLFKKLSLI